MNTLPPPRSQHTASLASGETASHPTKENTLNPLRDARELVEAVGEEVDNSGSRNQNPKDLSLIELIKEDFATHDGNLAEPGFWIIALHRFGNARMDVEYRILRAPLTLIYRVLKSLAGVLWGISLCYTTKLGRRVRIWHYGGMFLGARSIGNDVTLRHSTTFGLLHQGDGPDMKPIIRDRVDVGSGVAVLGPVEIGEDVTIGANSVVVKNVSPGATVFGIPARPVDLGRLRGVIGSERPVR
jgi:serine O-acetyltransferase